MMLLRYGDVRQRQRRPSSPDSFSSRMARACAGCPSRKVKILERAETIGDVLHAPNRFGKTLRVKSGPCNVVLRPFRNAFPWIVRSARNHDWIQADRVF